MELDPRGGRRRGAAWRRRAAFGLACLALLACTRRRSPAPARESPLPVVREDVVDLLARLPAAAAEGDPGFVAREFAWLRDDVRDALRLRPPVGVRFRQVPLHAGATLVFSYGVVSSVPSAPPVVLRVGLDEGGGLLPLFQETVAVAGVGGSGAWQEIEIPLPVSGVMRDLVFSATGGNADVRAVFGWPRLLSEGMPVGGREQVVREVTRLDLLAELDAAVREPNALGLAPRPGDLGLPGEAATGGYAVFPAGSRARWRLELFPGDFLRADPQPFARVPPGANGRPPGVRLVVRWRNLDAAGAPQGGWQPGGILRVRTDEPPRLLGLRGPPSDVSLAIPARGLRELEVGVEVVPDGPAPVDLTRLEILGRDTVRRRRAADPGRNVLVLLVDTLRADHLGLYGYPRDTSPNLDAAAARGVVFERAFTPATWTLPASVAVLSGLDPAAHGVAYRERPVLPAAVPLLSERFQAAGYTTAAFVANPLLGRAHGFARGFETFEELAFMDAARVGDRLAAWLRAHADERFFAYVHYIDPHPPFAAPGTFYSFFDPDYQGAVDHNLWAVGREPRARALGLAMADGWPVRLDPALGEEAGVGTGEVVFGAALHHRLVDLYDGEIRGWDAALAGLLRTLQAAGLDRDTLVVVTADHGEGLGDGGRFGHGFDFREETLRVPLILFGAGIDRPRRISAPASLVDVAALALELAGLPPLEGSAGRSLSALEAPGAETRVVVSHTAYFVPPASPPAFTGGACVRGAEVKLVQGSVAGETAAYRPGADGSEGGPLTPAEAGGELPTAELEAWVRRLAERGLMGAPPPSPGGGLDGALRALGYLR